jgi:hypothetical protein
MTFFYEASVNILHGFRNKKSVLLVSSYGCIRPECGETKWIRAVTPFLLRWHEQHQRPALRFGNVDTADSHTQLRALTKSSPARHGYLRHRILTGLLLSPIISDQALHIPNDVTCRSSILTLPNHSGPMAVSRQEALRLVLVRKSREFIKANACQGVQREQCYHALASGLT